MELNNKLGEWLTVLLKNIGVEMVSYDYRKESGNLLLRVYIDTPQGVSFETCAQSSRLIQSALDEQHPDFIYERLEVSSPGTNRMLTKTEDFIRFKGQRIKVKTREPLNERSNFTGNIVAADEAKISLDVDDKTIELPRSIIKKANLFPEY